MTVVAERATTSGGAVDRVAAFEAERARLLGLAYRMLGSRADAEDVVQDAWLRWDGAETTPPDNPAAWLRTTVSRLALDRLRARQRDRATYVGPWLPEPVLVAASASSGDPADRVVQHESLSIGFLHLLERLTPRERVAFVLTEVFDEPHARAAEVVGANATASRQLVRRARAKLAGDHARNALAPGDLAGVVDAFVTACESGEIDALLRVLAPDVELLSDGGADRHAARRPVVGRERVAHFVSTIVRRLPVGGWVERRDVNGAPALVLRDAGGPQIVVAIEATDAGLSRLSIVVAPAKLADLDRVVALV